MTRLTDTQLAILSRASERDDHAIELPPNLKGAAAHNVVSRLLEQGLLQEVPATGQMPVWRRDEQEQAVALVVTPAGLDAIDRDPGSVGERNEDPDERDPHSDRVVDEALPGLGCCIRDDAGDDDQGKIGEVASTRPPASGTKLAVILNLLRREQGATLDDLTGATGWLPHSARAGLTNLRRRGYEVLKARGEDGKTTYRVQVDAEADRQAEVA